MMIQQDRFSSLSRESRRDRCRSVSTDLRNRILLIIISSRKSTFESNDDDPFLFSSPVKFRRAFYLDRQKQRSKRETNKENLFFCSAVYAWLGLNKTCLPCSNLFSDRRKRTIDWKKKNSLGKTDEDSSSFESQILASKLNGERIERFSSSSS